MRASISKAWLTGAAASWHGRYAGQVDAAIIARTGWTRTAWLHEAADWLIAAVRWVIGVSLAAAFAAALAIGRLRGHEHVVHHLIPGRQFLVGARAETQVLLRCGQRLRVQRDNAPQHQRPHEKYAHRSSDHHSTHPRRIRISLTQYRLPGFPLKARGRARGAGRQASPNPLDVCRGRIHHSRNANCDSVRV